MCRWRLTGGGVGVGRGVGWGEGRKGGGLCWNASGLEWHLLHLGPADGLFYL